MPRTAPKVRRREMQAHSEHQQDHADFGELGRHFGIRHDAWGKRAHCYAGDQIPNKGRQPQPLGCKTEAKGQDKADRNRGDQGRTMSHYFPFSGPPVLLQRRSTQGQAGPQDFAHLIEPIHGQEIYILQKACRRLASPDGMICHRQPAPACFTAVLVSGFEDTGCQDRLGMQRSGPDVVELMGKARRDHNRLSPRQGRLLAGDPDLSLTLEDGEYLLYGVQIAGAPRSRVRTIARRGSSGRFPSAPRQACGW